jgi:hypothetical protein
MHYSQSPSLVEKQWPGDENSSGGRPRDLDTRPDQRIGVRPNQGSIHAHHSPSLKNDQAGSHHPSIGRRIFRTLTRFFITVLIGVGATLAWQSYGDEAREMLVTRAPTLAWLLSVATTNSPVVVASPLDPAQQLAPLTSNLDFVRRSLEQVAAKQEQLAQNIAALQVTEEDIRQKVSSAPLPPSQQPASTPQHKPPQSSSVPRPAPPPTGPMLLSR